MVRNLKIPKPQDFVTLAGTALTAEKNPEKRAHLEKDSENR